MTALLIATSLGGSDPGSFIVGLLATQGVAVTLVVFGALALYRDKWGSNTERDRLRKVEDLVLSEIVPNTQRSLLMSDTAVEATTKLVASMERLERVTGDLAELRVVLQREREELMRARIQLAERAGRDRGDGG